MTNNWFHLHSSLSARAAGQRTFFFYLRRRRVASTSPARLFFFFRAPNKKMWRHTVDLFSLCCFFLSFPPTGARPLAEQSGRLMLINPSPFFLLFRRRNIYVYPQAIKKGDPRKKLLSTFRSSTAGCLLSGLLGGYIETLLTRICLVSKTPLAVSGCCC